ncbi:ribose ABC transporter permease protein [Oxobacter pfennigii]|uniref:Ribose ABC transporter permease protein n=1 Tax=Oxobacter pfennigii TaxID=36849 RepID=A0A0P8WM98_9CLOT|nr:ABC transporter permease [Oxobacter pfennigii]KPU43637.1 ribose ABC transporter permease protein [Oxobacter pfennigii]
MIRFVKRAEISKLKSTLIRLSAIILALLLFAIFIYLISKENPFEVYASMLKGAFGSRYRFNEVVIKAVPLIISSLGIAIAFKMKFWNIGAEGQIMMGAFAASFIALKFPGLPQIVMLTAMVIAGVLMGGIWALIPAFFKAQWRTNETIVTLMLNYVALKFVTYLQYGPWKDPKATGFPKIPNFVDAAILPKVLGIHIGWIIAIVLAIVMYIVMTHSKLGYEVSVIGESERTAQYAGIDIKKTIITAVLISGGLCGLTGMIQASAVSNTLNIEVSGGLGFTAIITTWLSGLSAPFIVVASFLFAALLQGGSYIQTAFNIPASIALMLQGIILFFVLGSEFFINFMPVTQKQLNTMIKLQASGKEGK